MCVGDESGSSSAEHDGTEVVSLCARHHSTTNKAIGTVHLGGILEVLGIGGDDDDVIHSHTWRQGRRRSSPWTPFKVSHCFGGLDTFLRSPPQLCPLLNMANLELGGIPWYGVEVHT